MCHSWKHIKKTQARYGGYWRFPNMKDFCYLVNPYWPPVQMMEELRSSFATLATQYPSGAQEQSLLAGKVFGVDPNHIAVGNGAAERVRFKSALENCGLFVYPSQANFLLCRLSDDCKMTATELTVRLLDECNIFIKDLSTKIEDGRHIRLAVRDEADDDALVEAIARIIDGQGR